MKFFTKTIILKEMTIYISFICSLIIVLHNIVNFLGYDYPVFSYVGGTSVLMWILMWWISYTFNLCIYQRMFIYYIIFCNIIAMIDKYIGLPIDDLGYALVYCISFGITVILYGIFRLIETNSKQV